MITLKLGNNCHKVATRWSELTPADRDKFVSLCMALQDFETGAIDIDTYRYRAALALTGVDISKVKDFNENISETIYRISELTGFPLDIRSDENGVKFAYTDITLSENLLPKEGGYRFHVSDSGLVDCTITAAQYIDAVQLVDTYSKTREPLARAFLYSTLYNTKELPSPEEQVAVYYNFRGILDFIKKQPDYALIFAKTEASEGSIPASPLGMEGSVFQLSKSGYGDIESIRRLDLFSYLGVLVQMSVDSILTCKANKLPAGETAEKLRLPLELVLPYFSN